MGGNPGYRVKGPILKDFTKFKDALMILLDETILINERIDTIRPKSKEPMIKGLGPALLSALLLIEFPDKYCVFNGTSIAGMKKYGLLPNLKKTATEGEYYVAFNDIHLAIAKDMGVDLWTLDYIWWKAIDPQNSGDNELKILNENLLRFIDQSFEENNLKTSTYFKEYKGLSANLSFGMGRKAKVSWICFLKSGQTIQNGYYPGLYFDIENSTLFSVFGISEKNSPSETWSKDIIKEYYQFSNSDSSPNIKNNYRKSYIFAQYPIKQYELDDSLSENIDNIYQDLNYLIEVYNIIPDKDPNGGMTVSDLRIELMKQLLEQKKQIILYGPPGTGKTYLAKQYLQIHEIDKLESDSISFENNFYWFTANVQIWNPEELWEKGQIDLTFGTVASAYQEITEGDVVFMYVTSPYHQIQAIAECTKKEYPIENKPTVWIKGTKKIEGPKLSELKNDSVMAISKPVKMNAQGTLFSLTQDEGQRLLQMSKIAPEELNLNKIVIKKAVKNVEMISFHPSFCYEDFIEGLRPKLENDGQISYNVEEGLFKRFCRMSFNSLLNEAGLSIEWVEGTDIPQLSPEEMDMVKQIINDVPFYLCIDEINRGDISRIFGELITLLESDKRYNGKDSYFVTLPYSKTLFSVPQNLYIIGTMNTADKSIALVDVALRRRFGFIELMPDYKILEVNLVSEDSTIQDIFSLAISTLQILNERILLHYDRDHQIGHSFFLKLKECTSSEGCIEKFQFIWYYEVLPLLQEYFYDSPKKFLEVVGDKFITTTPNKKAFIFKDLLYEDDFIEAIQGLSSIQTDDSSLEEESE